MVRLHSNRKESVLPKRAPSGKPSSKPHWTWLLLLRSIAWKPPETFRTYSFPLLSRFLPLHLALRMNKDEDLQDWRLTQVLAYFWRRSRWQIDIFPALNFSLHSKGTEGWGPLILCWRDKWDWIRWHWERKSLKCFPLLAFPVLCGEEHGVALRQDGKRLLRGLLLDELLLIISADPLCSLHLVHEMINVYIEFFRATTSQA